VRYNILMWGYSVRKESSWYKPGNRETYTLSRTRIENFQKCPRCFWLEERWGVKKPSMPAFSLNNAVDELLKREFDAHRAQGTSHPLCEQYGVDAIPFAHPDLGAWRDSLKRGVQYLHEPTNLLIRGGVDDVWQSGDKKELIVVDYKATSTPKEISLDDHWKEAYKRQMEVYQWLLKQNGFPVSKTGYFVYVNGKADRKAFDAKLEFDVQLIPYSGDTAWVEHALYKIKECLDSDLIPPIGDDCEHCPYREAAGKALQRAAGAAAVSASVAAPKSRKPAKSKKDEKENLTAQLF